MKMKGQPNMDSNPVSPSQGSNYATDWANEAGYANCPVLKAFKFSDRNTYPDINPDVNTETPYVMILKKSGVDFD